MSAARPDRPASAAARLAGPGEGETAPSAVPGEAAALQQSRQALLRTQIDSRRWAAAEDHAQQRERRRIARELHDELQQSLASIQFELAALGQQLAASPGDVAGAAALLPQVSQLAQAAMESTRRIINDLRPPILEDLGLAAALEALVDRSALRSTVRYRFRASGDWDHAEPLPLDLAFGLYRVAQEALSNAARHAQARRIDVVLQLAAGGGIVMRIQDDGGGIAVEDWRKPAAFGLLGMYERVRAMGGDLQIDSGPAAGTQVAVVLAADRRSTQVDGLRDHVPGEEGADSLLSFLYSAPIGLVQAGLDGCIEMLNPMAANLLMPLSAQGRFDNLFTVLRDVLPQLRTQARALQDRSGIVCQDLRLSPQGSAGGAFRLSVLKQHGARLMAVLSPVGAEAAAPLPTPAADSPPAR